VNYFGIVWGRGVRVDSIIPNIFAATNFLQRKCLFLSLPDVRKVPTVARKNEKTDVFDK